jgi:hypothetical protein
VRVQIFCGNNKDIDTGGICKTSKEIRNECKYKWANVKDRHRFRLIGVDRRTILELILKK